MIYVDVTSACLLPLQSGIPRTTRGVYKIVFENTSSATPIFWQPFRASFTELSPRAQQLLENPFTEKSSRVPRDATLPLLWASFSDLLGPWPKAANLRNILREEDVLLLTSIFPDNRLEHLLKLSASPALKIAIFHDAIPLRDPNVAAWEKKRHAKTLQLFAQMDRIIAVSESARRELQDLWQEHGVTPHAEIIVIPWPVPFEGPRPEFSAPPSDKKRILYVSRLKQVKNHAALFDACEMLCHRGLDFELELIGCEDEVRESRVIAHRIAAMRAAGQPVLWRGHVTEEELHAAYQQATFTVFPSLAEGFGLPIIESFWHGRPVICGDRDAVGEISQGGGCLQIDVRNAEALAMGIESLLLDESRCQALAREAFARPLRSWVNYWHDLQPLLKK